MDLYGNMKLTVQLTVEGKKTYITFNAAESVSFATFGGLYSLESIYIYSIYATLLLFSNESFKN